MKGLLLKDLLLLKKQILCMILAMFIMYGFMILVILSIYYGNFKLVQDTFPMDNLLLIMSGFIGLCSGTFAGSFTLTFEEDRKADFFKVSLFVPVNSKGRILAKYMLYAIYLGIHLLIHLIMLPILFCVAQLPLNGLAILTILAVMSIGTLLILIELPIMYRLGGKCQSIINMGVIVLLCPIVFWFQNDVLNSNIALSVVTTTISRIITIVGGLFPILILIGFPLSGYLSWQVIEHRRNVLW